MRRRVLLVCSLALAFLAAPVMAQEDRLASVLEDFHARYGFPGATSAIALPEGTVMSAVTGLADVEQGRAMMPETPMLAASIGKSFVGAAVLALETEARLSRDDLLSAHLGDRPWFEALPNAATIKIDHLLHHTSGLPDHVHLPQFQRDWTLLTTGNGDFDPERLMAFVAGREALFEAGEAWA
jgi:D-alanyl-D-alanine carboxypeptidase